MSLEDMCDMNNSSQSKSSVSSIESDRTLRTKSERLDIRTKSLNKKDNNKTVSMPYLAEGKNQLQPRVVKYEDLPANAQMRRNKLSREYKQIIEDIKEKNCIIRELNRKLNQEYNSSSNISLLKSLHNVLKIESDKAKFLAQRAANIQRKYPEQVWETIPYNYEDETSICQEIKNENINANQIISSVAYVDPAAGGDDDNPNSNTFNDNEVKIDKNTKLVQDRSNSPSLDLNSLHFNDFDSELVKFQKELACRDRIIEGLEHKYVHLNSELSRMRIEHDKYVKVQSKNLTDNQIKENTSVRDETRNYQTNVCENTETSTSSTVSVSDSSIVDKSSMLSEHKFTEVIEQKSQKVTSKKQTNLNSRKMHKRSGSQNKENIEPTNSNYNSSTNLIQNDSELNSIFQAMKNIFNKSASQRNNDVLSHNMAEFKILQRKFTDLQCELSDFRNIIKEQQMKLEDYHKKYIKSQQIIVNQRNKIEKLHKSNKDLESEINCSLTQIREKFEAKLKEVSHLPRVIQFEQEKLEKANKEKNTLNQKINILKTEYNVLKEKLAELGKKKITSSTKLKNAERDLKIFKNQNTILKAEKRKLIEDLDKAKIELDKIHSGSNKLVGRTKERAELQRKALLKKINDLQLELGQSRENTKSLIQQRDKIICEMQVQLNTLVHNFEISQKHIRALRKHIFTLSGNCTIPEKSIV